MSQRRPIRENTIPGTRRCNQALPHSLWEPHLQFPALLKELSSALSIATKETGYRISSFLGCFSTSQPHQSYWRWTISHINWALVFKDHRTHDAMQMNLTCSSGGIKLCNFPAAPTCCWAFLLLHSRWPGLEWLSPFTTRLIPVGPVRLRFGVISPGSPTSGTGVVNLNFKC